MKKITCPKCGTEFTVEEDIEVIEKLVKEREKVIQANFDQRLKLEIDNAVNKKEKEKDEEISNLKASILDLKNDKKNAETNIQNEVDKAVLEKEKEILNLNNQIELSKAKFDADILDLKNKHKDEIKDLNDEIEKQKNHNLKLSVKLLGEALEQHCLNTFNLNRANTYPNAYFEKDNEVSPSGQKGDFIFRDKIDGNEYISIMFEMKNQNDESSTKHKNEDFFKKLDKDRNEKNCEYAVLVSELEPESELYTGITDVSYVYPKMYVVRPQNFMSIIAILCQAAKNSYKYQQELVALKSKNYDVSTFEKDLLDFQNSFGNNCRLAAEDFEKAIKSLDASIANLTKTREELLKSGRQMRIANEKLQDLSIKKLTKNNPTMKALFEEKKTSSEN